ncbi:MAG: XdhC/CoxI family protein, partial [Moraxellaceae bacterium]
QRQQDDAVIATVVQVEGSAYRRPGARMLIWSHGQSVGMISGGCLESEVCKKAQWLTRDDQIALKRYSTGQAPDDSDAVLADEDETLAFGLGCNGTVSVLFERLHRPAMQQVAKLLLDVQRSHRAAVIATVINAPDTGSLQLGDRILLDPLQRELIWCGQNNNVLSRALSQQIHNDLIFTLTCQKSRHQHYTTPHGDVALFIEYVPPPNRLVIFGAGHDAQPLVSMAKIQGWHVTVIDSRAHFAQSQHFLAADAVRHIGLNDLTALHQLHDWLKGAAVAVMTHSLSQDRHWLSYLLAHPPRYIGQLGPRYRTERLIDEIQQCCADPASLEAGLEVLHYPIGLDLGGDTSEAIALAIMAEITAVMNQRSGKMLKQHSYSIHAE